MTAKLSVIKGGGSPDPDAEFIAIAEAAAVKMVEAVKAGGGFWLLVDGEEMSIDYAGDRLELACMVEEIGRDMKRAQLGME